MHPRKRKDLQFFRVMRFKFYELNLWPFVTNLMNRQFDIEIHTFYHDHSGEAQNQQNNEFAHRETRFCVKKVNHD